MKADERIDLSNPCAHVTAEMPRRAHRPTPGCVECLAMGSRWVHLRICLSCGHVGCCDSSPNRHATKHHQATKHPVITSGEVGETWAYCYPDDRMLSAE
jgi:uncharacterized UBP type Zn finger protein